MLRFVDRRDMVSDYEANMVVSGERVLENN